MPDLPHPKSASESDHPCIRICKNLSETYYEEQIFLRVFDTYLLLHNQLKEFVCEKFNPLQLFYKCDE